MVYMLYFLIIIGVLLSIIAIFGVVIGISLTLGMRGKDACYKKKKKKEWIPAVLLTEEQKSRIVPNKRKLKKQSKISSPS